MSKRSYFSCFFFQVRPSIARTLPFCGGQRTEKFFPHRTSGDSGLFLVIDNLVKKKFFPLLGRRRFFFFFSGWSTFFLPFSTFFFEREEIPLFLLLRLSFLTPPPFSPPAEGTILVSLFSAMPETTSLLSPPPKMMKIMRPPSINHRSRLLADDTTVH